MHPPFVIGGKLKALSYDWTKKLAMEDEERDPTRYELFNKRKECENLLFIANIKREKSELEMVNAMLGYMRTVLRYAFEDGEKIQEIKNLIDSKRATRSMTAKFEKFKVEIRAIVKEIFSKIQLLEDSMNLKNIGWILEELVRDLSAIMDRLLANKKIMNRLLDRL